MHEDESLSKCNSIPKMVIHVLSDFQINVSFLVLNTRSSGTFPKLAAGPDPEKP
jgi:hypothetical protein